MHAAIEGVDEHGVRAILGHEMVFDPLKFSADARDLDERVANDRPSAAGERALCASGKTERRRDLPGRRVRG
jgi:hypothetical protein